MSRRTLDYQHAGPVHSFGTLTSSEATRRPVKICGPISLLGAIFYLLVLQGFALPNGDVSAMESSGHGISRAGLDHPAVDAQLRPASQTDDDDWHLVGKWEAFANPDDVRSIARDGESLWVGTASGGIARWHEDGQLIKQYLGPQDSLPCNNIRDIVQWQNRWYFATCKGLAVYEADRDRVVGIDTDFVSDDFTALSVDARGRLWVGMDQVWDDKATILNKETPGGWVGGGAAYTKDGTQWTFFGQANGLPSDRVRDIAMWRDQIFVATEALFYLEAAHRR